MNIAGSALRVYLLNLISGWLALLWSIATGRITWLAYHRAEICKDCEERNGKWCKVCKCYIPAKVRAKRSVCPKGYWKSKGGGGVGDGGV